MSDAHLRRRERRESARFAALSAGVGRRVAHLRVRANMTQDQLAAAADIEVKGLQALEAGAANPTLLLLDDIAGALDVPVASLVRPLAPGREPNPDRKPGKPRRRRAQKPR